MRSKPSRDRRDGPLNAQRAHAPCLTTGIVAAATEGLLAVMVARVLIVLVSTVTAHIAFVKPLVKAFSSL